MISIEGSTESADVELIDITSSSSVPIEMTKTKNYRQTNQKTTQKIGLPKKVHLVPRSSLNQGKNDRPVLIEDESTGGFERICDNPDCSAPTLISLVPTESTSQFVQNPRIIRSPVLVNGYTTVFQVDGQAPKVTEIKCSTSDGKVKYQTDSPIYRIIPNTHAHIVNYVVVDSDSDTMKKVKENDPATMKKLLNSQLASANTLLKRLLGAKKVDANLTTKSISVNIPPSKSSQSVQINPPTISSQLIPPPTVPIITGSSGQILSASQLMGTSTSIMPTVSNNSQPIIQNITIPKISSVVSGVSGVSALSTIARIPVPIPQPQSGMTTNIITAAAAAAPPTHLIPITPPTTNSSMIITAGGSQMINSSQPLIAQPTGIPIQSLNNVVVSTTSPASSSLTPIIINTSNVSAVEQISNISAPNLDALEQMQAQLKELQEKVKQLTQAATPTTTVATGATKVAENNRGKKRKLK